MRTLSWVRF